MEKSHVHCGKCGADCGKCGFQQNCKGCSATGGNPFGEGCVATEYVKIGGREAFEKFSDGLIAELNELQIEGMPKIERLNLLPGFFVNLAYPMPNGELVKLLKDGRVYLGTQVPSLFDPLEDGGEGRCYGIVADNGFLLVAEYGENGSNPELVCYRRR